MPAPSRDERRIGIEVELVSFAYGRKLIFRDISLQVPAGEIWALMGRSGIGKTTLLNIVTGLFRPTSGRVSTLAGPVRGPGSITGVVFRDPSLLGWRTVIDNVLFPQEFGQNKQRSDRAKRLLHLAGLSDVEGALPKELSAGMYRRVELVRAIMADESYFAADEPFTGLDVPTRLSLYEAWQAIQTENPRTGIMCTHDPIEAAMLCDAVVIMVRDTAGEVRVKQMRIPQDYANRRKTFEQELYADPFLREMLELMR